ncbi:MAG: type IX secretion system protein PorQ [Bacteroidota bacterium]
MRYILQILLLCSLPATAQFSGYQSLQLPSGARNAALGGKVVSISDGDITQFQHNPASLDSIQDTDIAISFSPYFAGIYQFSGQYYLPIEKIDGIAVGLNYLDYGDFISMDATGNVTGETFRGSDYLMSFGKSHRLNSFSIGVNLKLAHFAIETYSSTSILMDIGGMYHYPKGDFNIGLVFKNVGFRINDFYGSANTSLPFDVQIGASIKPQYMPIRFTMTAYNLVEENLVFREGSQTSGTVKAFDDFFRRINLGGELIFSKNVNLLLGYNHLRRQELSLNDKGAGAGFSYGLMISIKKFTFRYARSVYHANGGANFFTLQSNIRSFNKVL